jgi:hypothetical protein
VYEGSAGLGYYFRKMPHPLITVVDERTCFGQISGTYQGRIFRKTEVSYDEFGRGGQLLTKCFPPRFWIVGFLVPGKGCKFSGSRPTLGCTRRSAYKVPAASAIPPRRASSKGAVKLPAAGDLTCSGGEGLKAQPWGLVSQCWLLLVDISSAGF